MSGGGQDSEEAAELMATMRAEHVPMKAWFNCIAKDNNDGGGVRTELKSKHGEFPTFWQDLIKWEGWKETRRAYLKFTEGGSGSGSGSGSGGAVASPAPASASSKSDEKGSAAPAGTAATGKKRRSRWASQSDDAAAATAPALSSPEGGQPPERKRKSRWARGRDETPRPVHGTTSAPPDPVMAALGLGSSAAGASALPLPGLLPPGIDGLSSSLSPKQQAELSSLQERLRKANARLDNLEPEAARIDALARNHPDRSPSPPPVYGPDGTRKNTRANRWRERYSEERHNCLERIMDLVPAMRPAGFVRRKRSRKIMIPVEEHPTYNFIGLIIGPRGKTQKDMEAKTGCKIAIRGKGSIKEGAKGRRNGQQMEGDDERLHVVITGDDPGAIDAAAEMIESMLVVIDDEKNVHKQNQLRELALLNGTLKDEEWCHLCGEKGHRNFECPKRFGLGGPSVQIKCAICGDTSHPTRDCAMKPKDGAGPGGAADEAKAEQQLDSDYSAFMAELDGRPVPPPGKTGEAGAATAYANPAPSMSSVLTIIQPATVKRVGEGDTSGVTASASAIPAATVSGVTTISSNVPGVTTISSSLLASATGVTTISSTVPTSMTAGTADLSPVSSTHMPPPPPGPPPALAAPPLPAGGTAEPTPGSGGVAPLASLPPPPARTPAGSPPVAAAPGGIGLTSIPPPPPPPPPLPGASGATVPPPPPPPPPGYPPNGYPPQHPQQGGGGWNAYPPQYQQQGGYPPSAYGQVHQQQQSWGAGANANAPGQGERGRNDDETAGWDPRSYFGTEATGGDAGGAGGFNWWE